MKRLSIFFAALMACTLSFAQTDYSTTYTSNVTLTAGTNASAAKIVIGDNTYDGVKAGTSSKAGVISITVPANMTNLHIHAIAWKGVTGASVSITSGTEGVTCTPAALTLANNAGITNNSPFTISGDMLEDYYFNVALTGVTSETTLTLTCDKRFVVFGVNAVAAQAVEATAIALDKTTLELEQYKSAKLEATLTPAEATTAIAWTSSAEDVATVGSNGIVTTLGVGTAIITATAGELTATCNVTVNAATVFTCAQIVEKAESLKGGAVMENGKYVVRGFVTALQGTPSSDMSKYKNYSVWMADTKDGGKVFEAFQVAPADGKTIAEVGNYVEVIGDITKYIDKSENITIETVGKGAATISILPNKYVVAATANNDAMGTVTGAGLYDENAEVTVTATAKQGYRFMGWNNGETNTTLTFTAADTTLVANFQSVANTFAYGLESELSEDGTELDVIYELNNNAKAVQIIVMNGEDVVETFDCEGITKGMHMETINTSTLPKNVKLTWKVEITDIANEAVAELGINYSFYHPSTVDIDLNPENETFGLILCNEAMHVAKGKKGYQSSNFGAGIFAFTPDFEPIANGEKPGFNGGNEFVEKDATGTSYVPRRIRISKDGRIFVTSLGANGTYLWEVNPKNMDEWTPVMTGTADEQYELVDAEGNFIAGPNAGFDVRGEGENLQLLMLSANKSGFGYAPAGYKCSEYNLGTATTWNQTRTRAIFDGIYGINPAGVQVQYDAEGGVWFASNRATTKDNEPGLVHFNAAGIEDYKELRNNTKNAGFRFNHDFTKVVIGTNGKIGTIYAVSKDADGKPVLTEEMQINMATAGTNLNDFAWDYANNLYVVSNSGEKIVAYALPHAADTKVATPAASKYAFTIGGIGTYVDNTDANNATVTEKIVRDGQVLIIRDGKTYNMMGQIVE